MYQGRIRPSDYCKRVLWKLQQLDFAQKTYILTTFCEIHVEHQSRDRRVCLNKTRVKEREKGGPFKRLLESSVAHCDYYHQRLIDMTRTTAEATFSLGFLGESFIYAGTKLFLLSAESPEQVESR